MNITMPAPTPTAPPAAAPNDRVVGRETTTTSTHHSTGRQTDEERTFEEQLDDVAIALAPTTRPAPIEAPTEQRTNPDPTITTGAAATTVTTVAAGVGAVVPPTTAVVAEPAKAMPDASTPSGPALTPPTGAPLATPPVAVTPVITEIEAPPIAVPTASADVTADPVAGDDAPASADAALTLPPGPAGTTDVPTGTDTPVAVPPADAATPPAPIAAPGEGQGPAPVQTALAAAVRAAATATATDAVTDADVDTVTDIDGAGPAVTDASTQPALAIHAPSVRHGDTSPTPAGGAVPVLAESADDLAVPSRIAPPRTIAVDLNDEGLGPLRVIATSEQRTVHLTVSASEAVVREALVRQQTDLRHDLADAGLQLGSFEVDSRAGDRDQANQPTTTGDRDRPSARSGGALAATASIPTTHDADGRLDLRL